MTRKPFFRITDLIRHKPDSTAKEEHNRLDSSGLQTTVKLINFRTPENFAVIYQKFKKKRQNLLIFPLKDANGKANSEDPAQTAPLGAV